MMIEQLDVHSHAKKVNLDTDPAGFTKIDSKWIKDLNIKCKTITLLENNMLENLAKLGYGHPVLDTPPKTRSIKK